MEIKEDILRILVKIDLLGDGASKGIAAQAISQGYASLSDKQKYVLSKHFNPSCEGHEFDDCDRTLTDEEHLSALEAYSDRISCFDCMAQIEHQEHTWAKMEKE